MKTTVLSLFILAVSMALQAETPLQAEKLFDEHEKLAPLNIFEHQTVDLFENKQVIIWCTVDCRALKDQCLLTNTSNYCTVQFGDCVDKCLEDDTLDGGFAAVGSNNLQIQ